MATTPLPGDAALMTYRGHAVLHTLIRCRLAPPPGSDGGLFLGTGCASGAVIGKGAGLNPRGAYGVGGQAGLKEGGVVEAHWWRLVGGAKPDWVLGGGRGLRSGRGLTAHLICVMWAGLNGGGGVESHWVLRVGGA